MWWTYIPANLKVITEPFVAVTLLGMNWKTPPGELEVLPTWIDFRNKLLKLHNSMKKEAITYNILSSSSSSQKQTGKDSVLHYFLFFSSKVVRRRNVGGVKRQSELFGRLCIRKEPLCCQHWLSCWYPVSTLRKYFSWMSFFATMERSFTGITAVLSINSSNHHATAWRMKRL